MAIYTHLKWQYFTFLGLLLCILASLSYARTQQDSLTHIYSFSVPFPMDAITVSGDEALIAISMKTNATDSRVQIYDRQSQKPLVQIALQGKSIRQIQFDHYTRQLALVDATHIQLWNLEEFPLQPNHPLSSQYLIDKIPHQMKLGAEIKFSQQSKALIWTENNQLQKLPLSKPPFQATTLWVGEQASSLQSFSFDQNEEWLAYSLANDNRILLVNPNQKQTKLDLDYHHFPVIKTLFIAPKTVLSLDSERNVIWGNMESRVKTHGIFLKELSSEEMTQDVHTIYQDQFLAIITKNTKTSEIFAHIIDKNGSLLHKMPLGTLNSFATSPTGSYIFAAPSLKQVNVYQLQPHQNPIDYIRHLEEKGAFEMARHYRNHLEILPSELSTIHQKSSTLQNLIAHLNSAINLEHWTEVNQWITKILEQDPKNPQALSAKKLLNAHHDLVLLEEGKEEVQKANLENAIRVLTQIPRTSPHRLEARQLIATAEKKIKLKNAFEKSKQEVRLQNWAKAKALLLPVLTQDPTHQEAQALLSEIEDQERTSEILNLTTVLSLFVFLGGLGFLAIKKRKQVIDWLSLTEKEAAPLKPPLGRNKINPLSDNSLAKKTFLETLEKTKTVLALSKKADQTGKYTARFIDFEAEIAVIRKKASHPEAPYNHLSNQLLHILQTLRSFNFETAQKQANADSQSNSHKKPSQPPPSSQQAPNYYQILNVSPNASRQEIKRAYHEQMKTYHPDLHQNSGFDWVKKEAESKTRLIQKAYDTLKSQQSRRQYDKSIHS